MTRSRRTLSWVLAACIGVGGFAQTAQATLIGTAEVAAAQRGAATVGSSAAHERALSALDRADVAAALAARGVDVREARERVAALSDTDAARLADALDSAPAGGDVIGVIVFIFVLLLVTDILGFTKIFPFTRPIR